MKRGMALILLLTGTLLAGGAGLAWAEGARTYVFHVEGMTCELCAKAIRKALLRVEGVQDVEVERGSERVSAVADAALAAERLEQAIESSGAYEAELLEVR